MAKLPEKRLVEMWDAEESFNLIQAAAL